MRHRFPALTALLSLAILGACAGGGGEPDTARVARVEVRSATVQTFTGHRVPLAALVTAYDGAGRVIASPPASELAVALPAGWTREGDDLVAPNFEFEGVVRFAVAGAGAGLSVAAPPPGVDGSVLDSTTVVASVDLRLHQWSLAWRCSPTGGVVVPSGRAGVSVTSARYEAVVDTANYPGDSAYFFSGVTARVALSGRAVRALSDGTTDTVAYADTLELGRQRVDTLWMDVTYPTGAHSSASRGFVRRGGTLQAPPLRYVGPALCRVIFTDAGWWGPMLQPDSTVLEERVTLPSP
ncbi:MAG: hypothetical protein ACJ8AO_05525 [Gemmatimonadaceae bacterium]